MDTTVFKRTRLLDIPEVLQDVLDVNSPFEKEPLSKILSRPLFISGLGDIEGSLWMLRTTARLS